MAFEEKTYEEYFNMELHAKTKIIFPPGQVQEGLLGFDAAARAISHRLWRHLGYPFWFTVPFEGEDLKLIAGEMERAFGKSIRELPSIKANLLFQYKRSEYKKSKTCKEWHLWNQPYYRYAIESHQQTLLEHIEMKFGKEVLVLYAAPAIHDVNMLIDAHKNKKVIRSSNFKKVSELKGHHRNTFVEAGRYSIACSDPESIEDFDLVEMLNSLQDLKNNGDNYSNASIINRFREGLVSLISEDSYLSQAFRKMIEEYDDIQEYPLLYSFIVLRNFRLLTGVQWILAF